jgi:cytochrome c oxidase subunit IV
MLLGLIILAVALAISGVSAYYSILGLTAIFAADPMPIIIMGAVLEAGKISTAVWLHHNWNRISLRFKFYMVPALVFLMMLTSMGVFGFLSKAHIDQGLPTATVQSKIDILEQQIKNKQSVITSDQLMLKQMDQEVSQVMNRSNTVYGARLSGEIMQHQKAQRDQLTSEITNAQTTIIALKEQEQPLISQVSKISAEVGPIKYVAALIYGAKGDNPDLLQSAVRWVIILIVVVFDPLALTLILAGTQQISWSKKESSDPKVDTLNQELDEYRQMSARLEEELAEALRKQVELANKNSDLGFEQKDSLKLLEQRAAEIRELKQQNQLLTTEQPVTETVVQEIVKEVPVEVIKEVVKEVPVEVIKEVVKEVQVVDEAAVTTLKNIVEQRDRHIQELLEQLSLAQQIPVTTAVAATVVEQPKVKIAFGDAFPNGPSRGDLFIRVDFRPTRLFKWNGVTWVGINKSVVKDYALDSKYIENLMNRMARGEYDTSDLTAEEQEQVRMRGGNI